MQLTPCEKNRYLLQDLSHILDFVYNNHLCLTEILKIVSHLQD